MSTIQLTRLRFQTLSASYIDKIVQLPLSLPKIDESRVQSFAKGLISVDELKDCATIFVKGMLFNPRKVKRVIRVFMFLHELVNNEPGEIALDPHLLAKLVLIQQEFPTVYEDIIRRPQLLPALEWLSKGEAPNDFIDPALTEIARAYVDKFALLRSALLVATGTGFQIDTVSAYLYFLTSIAQSQPPMTSPQPGTELLATEYLSRVLRELQGTIIRTSSGTAESGDFFVEPTFRGVPQLGGDRSLHFREVARLSTKVLIVGDPGSGKTTTLQWVARSCIRGFLSMEPSVQASEIGIPEPVVPVIIRLPNVRDLRSVDLIEVCRSEMALRDEKVSRDDVRAMLSSNRLLLLLDDFAPEVGEALTLLLASFPGLRCVATSRPLTAVDARLPGFSVYVIQPLNEEQIARLTAQWMHGLKIPKKRQEEIKENLRRFPLSIVESPMFLSMLLPLYAENRQLPTSPTQLIRQFVESSLQREHYKWESGTEDRALTARGVHALQDLALKQLREDRNEMTSYELTRSVEQTTGSTNVEDIGQVLEWTRRFSVIIGTSSGQYRFAHRLFQEYFAALALLRGELGGDVLDELLSDSKWHAVLLFIADAAPTQGPELVRRALALNGHDFGLLSLAAEVALIAEVKNSALITRVTSALEEVSNNSTTEDRVRREAQRLSDLLAALIGKS